MLPGSRIYVRDWGPGSGPNGTLHPSLWTCEPANPPIVIRWYGSVSQTFDSGSDANGWPVSIWTDSQTAPLWEEITDEFDFSFFTIAGRSYLEIQRTSGSWSGGQYEVRYDDSPTGDYQSTIPALQDRGGLTMGDVSGGVRLASFTAPINRGDRCREELEFSMFNVNEDETLCSEDVAAWIDTPVDFNADSAADSGDMTLLLEVIDFYDSLD